MNNIAKSGITQRQEQRIVLSGRPSLQDFVAFVRNLAEGAGIRRDQVPSESDLMSEWSAANQEVKILESQEAGFVDFPKVLALPEECGPLAEQLRSDEAFRNSCRSFVWEFGMAPIDQLIVVQREASLDHVKRIRMSLGDQPDLLDAAKLAFGIDQVQSPISVSPGGDIYTFLSQSRDFRVLESYLADASHIPSPIVKGCPEHYVVIGVGFSRNCIMVINSGRRLVLVNGIHRALALREAGFTHAPCVVRKLRFKEEIETIGLRDLTSRADYFLIGPRPPLLNDFRNRLLHRMCAAPKIQRMLRIHIRSELVDLPISAEA